MLRPTFWAVFMLGSASLLFGLLLTQTPGDDRTFDRNVLSTALIIIIASALIGGFHRGMSRWKASPVLAAILGGELILCLYALVRIPAKVARRSGEIVATHSGMIVAMHSGASLPPPCRSEATLVFYEIEHRETSVKKNTLEYQTHHHLLSAFRVYLRKV